VVQVLIEAGADVNKANDKGATPLFVANHNGHVAEVRVLIVAGADVNKATDDGVMPLCMAAQFGHEVVVRALIKAGADVNAAGNNGATPLLVSTTPAFNIAQGNHAAVVKMLKGAGAV
jgi:ankyrin repeat protein